MPGTKRALFLDWGGTLAVTKDNQTLVDAAGNPILTPNAGRVLARERPRFDVCFIVSNRPGVARGEISLAEVGRRLAWANERRNIPGLDWRLCPHTDEDGCDCRKPKPGMFLELARLYGVDLAGSTHVGDVEKDRLAAAAAGGGTLLLARGLFRAGGGGAVGPLEGRAKRMVVPRPGSLSIQSSPPCASTRCLTIASPSPVPPIGTAVVPSSPRSRRHTSSPSITGSIRSRTTRSGEAFALEVQHDEPPDVGLVFDDENVLGQRYPRQARKFA